MCTSVSGIPGIWEKLTFHNASRKLNHYYYANIQGNIHASLFPSTGSFKLHFISENKVREGIVAGANDGHNLHTVVTHY